MYKLLIVDDEALAQIGMRSMLDYASLGIEVVGVANNGKEALEMIARYRPAVVITDIKMPVMDGLELISRCNEQMADAPSFIVLTSHDDFDFVRKALRENVVDYLIKLELTAETLKEAIEKALETQKKQRMDRQEGIRGMLANHFFNQLLNRVFLDENEILKRTGELGISLKAPCYFVMAVRLDFSAFAQKNEDDICKLYSAVLNMIGIKLGTYKKSYAVAYDSSLIGILLCGEEEELRGVLREIFVHIDELSRKYFNVPLCGSVGPAARRLCDVSASFSAAQSLLKTAHLGELICWNGEEKMPERAGRNAYEINQALLKAVDELDAEAFQRAMDKVAVQISQGKFRLEEDIDTVSEIMHMLANNMEHGRKALLQAFCETPHSYLAIYSVNSHRELLEFFMRINRAIVNEMNQCRQDSRNNLVRMAQRYIHEHIEEKLSLNDVASQVNISPGYLSALFRKHCQFGFNDYVMRQKLKVASQLLKEGKLKVYQISAMLGFDTPYYFSTVYKKYNGISPTEVAQEQTEMKEE